MHAQVEGAESERISSQLSAEPVAGRDLKTKSLGVSPTAPPRRPSANVYLSL